MKIFKSIFLLLCFLIFSCQAMKQVPSKKNKNKSLALKDIPTDCLLEVFTFFPFDKLLHKISLVSKEWKNQVSILFKSKNRGATFGINIAVPIKHAKYIYELSQFAQFLEKSIVAPYYLHCPFFSNRSKMEIEKTEINSDDAHKKFLEKVHNRLRFNFGYANEYATKWRPCYLYSIMKHLRDINPPYRLRLFSNYDIKKRMHLVSNAMKGICTCGRNHFPKFTSEHEVMEMREVAPNGKSLGCYPNTVYSYRDGDYRTYGVHYSVEYIEIDSEERKKELIENITQTLQNEANFLIQDISEVHTEIAKNKKKLTKHYKSWWKEKLLAGGVLALGIFSLWYLHNYHPQ